MIVKHYCEIRAEPVVDVPGMTVRWLVSDLEEEPRFALRLYELAPGAVTTPHAHHWEHQVFMLKGQGLVVGEEDERQIGEGDLVYISPLERHQFVNTGSDILRFLMAFPIPRKGLSISAEAAGSGAGAVEHG